MHKLILSLMLLGLASPALAAGCRYMEQDLPDFTGKNAYIDLIDDSHMRLSDFKGLCTYFTDDSGGHINCPGQKETFFSFAGKSPHDSGIDLIIRDGSAWYRDPGCAD